MVFFVHPRSFDRLDPLPSCIARTGGVRRYANATRLELLEERLVDLGLASYAMMEHLADGLMERQIEVGRASVKAMKKLRDAGLASDAVLAELDVIAFNLDPNVARFILREDVADKVVFFEIFCGGKDILGGFLVSMQDLKGMLRRGELPKSIVVRFDRSWAAEIIDEFEGKFFFLAGLGDAEVFDGEKGPFIRDNKPHEVKLPLRAENVRARSDDKGNVFRGEK